MLWLVTKSKLNPYDKASRSEAQNTLQVLARNMQGHYGNHHLMVVRNIRTGIGIKMGRVMLPDVFCQGVRLWGQIKFDTCNFLSHITIRPPFLFPFLEESIIYAVSHFHHITSLLFYILQMLVETPKSHQIFQVNVLRINLGVGRWVGMHPRFSQLALILTSTGLTRSFNSPNSPIWRRRKNNIH